MAPPPPGKRPPPKGKQKDVKKPFTEHMKSSFEKVDPHLRHQQRLGAEPGVILQNTDQAPPTPVARVRTDAGIALPPLAALPRSILRDVWGNGAAAFPELKLDGYVVLRADRTLLHLVPGKAPAVLSENDSRFPGRLRQEIITILSAFKTMGTKTVRTVGGSLLQGVRLDAPTLELAQLRAAYLDRVGNELKRMLGEPGAPADTKALVAQHGADPLVAKLREAYRPLLEKQGEEQINRACTEDLGRIATGLVMGNLARVAQALAQGK